MPLELHEKQHLTEEADSLDCLCVRRQVGLEESRLRQVGQCCICLHEHSCCDVNWWPLGRQRCVLASEWDPLLSGCEWQYTVAQQLSKVALQLNGIVSCHIKTLSLRNSAVWSNWNVAPLIERFALPHQNWLFWGMFLARTSYSETCLLKLAFPRAIFVKVKQHDPPCEAEA